RPIGDRGICNWYLARPRCRTVQRRPIRRLHYVGHRGTYSARHLPRPDQKAAIGIRNSCLTPDRCAPFQTPIGSEEEIFLHPSDKLLTISPAPSDSLPYYSLITPRDEHHTEL